MGRGLTLLFSFHRNYTVRLYLSHTAAGAFRLKITHELRKIHVIANVEADMHRPRICWAHVIARFRPAVSISHGLFSSAILQEFNHEIIELDEADIQSLRTVFQVGHSDRARV